MKSNLLRVGIFVMLLAVIVAGCAPAAPEVVEVEKEVVVEVTRMVEVEGETVIEEVEIVVTATPEPMVMEPFRVAMIIPSSIKDLAWGQSMYEALAAVQADVGEDMFEIAYSESMFSVPDAAAAMRDYAADGYDLVIAHGSQYGSSLAEVAVDFPDTSFAWGSTVNTYQSEGIENIFAYAARTEDSGYLEGVLMGSMTETNSVTYCGPIEAGDHALHNKGWKLGLEAAKPGIQINEVWTGSYGDVSLMAACAETGIQAGSDLITGGSQSITGSIGVAKDNDVLYFGGQWDQTDLAPEVVVVSYVYDWSAIVADMMVSHEAGVMGGKVYWGTYQNGGLRDIFNPAIEIPAEAQAAYDAALAGILSGEIKVEVE
jgi:basic membrane lipoprotein Med (substrate-binding protein (PBP1-ABC) superfamily)